MVSYGMFVLDVLSLKFSPENSLGIDCLDSPSISRCRLSAPTLKSLFSDFDAEFV